MSTRANEWHTNEFVPQNADTTQPLEDMHALLLASTSIKLLSTVCGCQEQHTCWRRQSRC
jgi:hypothetical protein